jgi:DNA-binding beta-propeller fold protein YncE
MMNLLRFRFSFIVVLILWSAASAQRSGQIPLRLEKTIPLHGVEGRIDHLSVDIVGQRLFVAALGNSSVEVIDLKAGARIHSITGLKEPQGIAYYPPAHALFVASGGDGTTKVFDTSSFRLTKTIQHGDDADNVRLDEVNKQIIVGYGDGALSILDTDGKQLGEIKLDAHPESFQLERNSSRVFVNVPKKEHVAVVDRAKRTLIARWSLAGNQANFPMALDENGRRLFVVCRKPARLLVFNIDSGKVVAQLDCVGDSDDIFYDSKRKRIYASGGEGAISVYAQRDADHYEQIAKLATASGARTGLFVASLSRLFLAVPHRGEQSAAIRVYEVVE